MPSLVAVFLSWSARMRALVGERYQALGESLVRTEERLPGQNQSHVEIQIPRHVQVDAVFEGWRELVSREIAWKTKPSVKHFVILRSSSLAGMVLSCSHQGKMSAKQNEPAVERQGQSHVVRVCS